MPKPSAISVFVAATSLLVASAPALLAQDAGGLKEWTTDQGVDEESVLDSDAAALKKKAEQEDICVPIGEGENCWRFDHDFFQGGHDPLFYPKKKRPHLERFCFDH